MSTKSLKVMLLGLIIMVFGISLSLGTTQYLALRYANLPIDFINSWAIISFTIVGIGLVIGVVGFFLREHKPSSN